MGGGWGYGSVKVSIIICFLDWGLVWCGPFFIGVVDFFVLFLDGPAFVCVLKDSLWSLRGKLGFANYITNEVLNMLDQLNLQAKNVG